MEKLRQGDIIEYYSGEPLYFPVSHLLVLGTEGRFLRVRRLGLDHDQSFLVLAEEAAEATLQVPQVSNFNFVYFPEQAAPLWPCSDNITAGTGINSTNVFPYSPAWAWNSTATYASSEALVLSWWRRLSTR